MDRKALSLPILTSLVIGNMIGTGIYLLPASLAAFGTISILGWVYTSLGAIFLALTLVSLTKRFPKTGGPYVYCKQAYGPFMGFFVAYTYWLSNLVSIGGLAVSSVNYLGFIAPSLNSNDPSYNSVAVLLVELGIVWLFTAINLIGIHTAGVVQLVLTIIKISPLIIISIIGFGYIHLENLTQFTVGNETNFVAISSAAMLTFWAFIGLESATVPAENTKGYSDIFKATVYGAIATSIIYIVSTFVIMGMLPLNQLQHSQFPFAEAATQIFGPSAALIITLCAVISGLGSLNVCVLVQGQLVFAAARDHLFPKRFTKLSKHDVPVTAQIFSGCLISLFLITTVDPSLLKQFNNIALLATLLTLITYFATTIAQLKFILLAKKSVFHLVFSKSLLITLIAAFYCFWMISSFSKEFLLIVLFMFALAVPIYFLFIKKQVLGSL